MQRFLDDDDGEWLENGDGDDDDDDDGVQMNGV